MKQINIKKFILSNIPYAVIALLATKLGEAMRLAPGVNASEKLLHLMVGLSLAFSSFLPSLHPIDLLVGIAAALLLRLAVYMKARTPRNTAKT